MNGGAIGTLQREVWLVDLGKIPTNLTLANGIELEVTISCEISRERERERKWGIKEESQRTCFHRHHSCPFGYTFKSYREGYKGLMLEC